VGSLGDGRDPERPVRDQALTPVDARIDAKSIVPSVCLGSRWVRSQRQTPRGFGPHASREIRLSGERAMAHRRRRARLLRYTECGNPQRDSIVRWGALGIASAPDGLARTVSQNVSAKCIHYSGPRLINAGSRWPPRKPHQAREAKDKQKQFAWPVAETATHWITVGFDKDHNNVKSLAAKKCDCVPRRTQIDDARCLCAVQHRCHPAGDPDRRHRARRTCDDPEEPVHGRAASADGGDLMAAALFGANSSLVGRTVVFRLRRGYRRGEVTDKIASVGWQLCHAPHANLQFS
jgi:hypothetical protein